jgi:hypothetical protein
MGSCRLIDACGEDVDRPARFTKRRLVRGQRGKEHVRLERGGIFDARGTIRFEYLMRI